MTVLEHASTDYEELHQKLHRIQGEAWGGYATLPQRMPVPQSTGDVIIRPTRQPPADEEGPYSIDLSANDTVAFRKAVVASSDAAEPSNVRISEVLRESLESLRRATEEWKHLTSIKSDVFRESLQAFTQASETTSLRESLRSLFERPDESDWNDAKNDRRCELIDKEIEGTLVPVEKRELEELQRQMLAYRRKVAPLPLKEAQRLHQQLLKKAAGQAD